MIFTCNSCNNVFSRSKKPDICPQCGENTVVPASKISYPISGSDRFEVVNISEIRPHIVSCFTYTIPAKALGINSEKNMEIVVEYIEHRTNECFLITAETWARELNDTVGGFILPVQLTSDIYLPQDQLIECLLDVINNNHMFREQLEKFIQTLEKI